MGARAKLLELDSRRKSLEEELKEHLDILKSNGVGMDDALVDSEDYPRNDIDVYQVLDIHEKSRTEGNGTNCVSNRVVLPSCFAAIDLVTEGGEAEPRKRDTSEGGAKLVRRPPS